jgi:hypothetical protein
MPEFNPSGAWHDCVFPAQGLRPDQTLGQGNYKGLLGRVSNYLSTRTADEQFKFDTAMWYGAITQPGSSWKANVLKRLFLVLYYGGLMVHREDGWVSWKSLGQPICGSISHGARVLIWLPENDNLGAFWTWLWAGHAPESRGAATHGIEPLPQTADIDPPNQVMKGIKETKGDNNVDHYGINIALGGDNRMNPVSGKTSSENGKHGHLYIAYHKEIKRTLRSNLAVARRAILVNCEQSAPIDRQVAVKGTFGKVKSVFRGIEVPDQYGGGHGLGGHSRFGATGGDDFSYETKGGVAPTNLGDFGPSQGHYYDGMFIDLSADRFTLVQQATWANSIIGGAGEDPVPPVRKPRLGRYIPRV